MLCKIDNDAPAAVELQVSLQDSLQVCRASDRVDAVGGPPSLHQGGDGLSQVQVVQVVRDHVLRRGHTCVDIHLPGANKSGRGGVYAGSQERSNVCYVRCFFVVWFQLCAVDRSITIISILMLK